MVSAHQTPTCNTLIINKSKMWFWLKRATIRCLFSFFGYRQVTMHVYKQEQFTPSMDMNLLNCLLPVVEYWRYSRMRETRAESSSIYKDSRSTIRSLCAKQRTGDDALSVWLIITVCLLGPLVESAASDAAFLGIQNLSFLRSLWLFSVLNGYYYIDFRIIQRYAWWCLASIHRGRSPFRFVIDEEVFRRL